MTFLRYHVVDFVAKSESPRRELQGRRWRCRPISSILSPHRSGSIPTMALQGLKLSDVIDFVSNRPGSSPAVGISSLWSFSSPKRPGLDR